jgi:hypothetical protein
VPCCLRKLLFPAVQADVPLPLLNTEQQELNVLLRELLYLPIAVVQQAACMDTSSMTVQEYQAQLDKDN